LRNWKKNNPLHRAVCFPFSGLAESRQGGESETGSTRETNMTIEFLRDIDTWSHLESEWNALLSRSAANYPFLRYEFQRAWWEHLGGGEWPSGELRIAAWREGGDLRGVAPLFQSTREGEMRWYFIGSMEISDYLDVIVEGEHHSAFCTALLDALGSLPDSEFRVLDLFNLRAASPTASILEADAGRRGWKVDRETLQICPVLALPESWEEYLAALDKKDRHEIRRKLRRSEGAEEPMELKLADAGAMEEFFSLMAADKNKAGFLTPAMRDQFRSIARSMEAAGLLQLAFLQAQGRNVAAFFNFDYDNRIWVYNSGMDPQYAASSPGWILLALLVRRAIEQGREAFDFMRGSEPYKFQWGGVGEQIHRLTIRKD
jgi:CelD/BcsL family acetyltransferase involved in cellulose biosynthesis